MSYLFKKIKTLLEEVSDLELASDPTIPSDKLTDLHYQYNITNPEHQPIFSALASNPQTDTRHYKQYVRHGFDNEVMENPMLPIAEVEDPGFFNKMVGHHDDLNINPNTVAVAVKAKHPELIRRLAEIPDQRDENNLINAGLFLNPNTPEHLKKDLLNKISLKILAQKTTSKALLEKLAQHSDPQIVKNVSENYATPQAVLDNLINHPDPDVLAGVLNNPNVTWQTRHHAFNTKNVTPEYLEKLKKVLAKNTHVHHEAAQLLTNPDLLDLIYDKSKWKDVHKLILQNPSVGPTTLDKVANEKIAEFNKSKETGQHNKAIYDRRDLGEIHDHANTSQHTKNKILAAIRGR